MAAAGATGERRRAARGVGELRDDGPQILFECRHVALDRIPNALGMNPEILMHDYVAQPGPPLTVDCRVSGLKLGRHGTQGFSDDGQVVEKPDLDELIREEGLATAGEVLLDASYRRESIARSEQVRPHSGTASSRMARRISGRRSLSTARSTLTPRAASSACQNAPQARSDRVGARSDEEIEVAVGATLPPRDRPKHAHVGRAEGRRDPENEVALNAEAGEVDHVSK